MEEEPLPLLEKLRSLVADCLDKHLFTTAVFFADKLVTLSDGDAEDVYRLAQARSAPGACASRKLTARFTQAFLHSGQHRRALALLRAEKLTSAGERFVHLAGLCLVAARQWEEAIELLGDGRSAQPEHASRAGTEDGGVATAAALAVLRGRVYIGLENRTAAARCFKTALAIDPLCYEAFDALASGHMLTPTEEAAMLATLQWAPGDGWVGALYGIQASAHNAGANLPAQLDTLAAEAAAAGAGDEAVAALRENADVVAATAEWALARGEVSTAYAATSALLARDPLRASALPTHLSAAATLGKRNELFARGHDLVQADPESGVAWYAVGCYYASAGQHAAARRFLAKCTAVAPGFAPGWLAYGHAFAAMDETDQALAAYRTAVRLFPGTPAPLLWVGVEYGRAVNWPLARQFLQMASDACPSDPAPFHELGCIELRAGEPQAAQAAFEQALNLAPQPLTETWEPTFFGLGHSLRKQGKLEAAEEAYRRALGLVPRSASTLVALAFTAQLRGDNTTAVELYHVALGLRPDDGFAQEMLTEALADACAAY